MAIETQVISTQEIKPIFATDASTTALGTAHDNGDTWNNLPLLSYTIPYSSSALEVAPNRTGSYGQLEQQGKHRKDTNTWTMDVSFSGTPTAVLSCCQWAWGDGSSASLLTPALGIGNGTSGDMQMKHGVASANHTTALLVNGGTDASADDLTVKGLVVQSMTLKEDVGANAGQLTCDATLWTAYPPSEAADSSITADAIDTAAPKSIFNLNTGSASAITLATEELMPLSWELTISRTLERVGSQDYSSFLPYAYAQTAAWEVTGSLTVKADDNTYDLVASLAGGSAGVNLSIDESSGFAIDMDDVMVDNVTVDNGGAYLTHTIPFRAFAASTTATILSITIT